MEFWQENKQIRGEGRKVRGGERVAVLVIL